MATGEHVIDAYVKIDTIPGEATAAGFEKQIQFFNFTHSITQEPSSSKSSTGAQASGRVETGRITFRKDVDFATPQLMQACAEGRHISSIKFSFTRAGTKQNVYYTVTLTDSLVTRVTQNTVSHDIVNEEVELYFKQIQWEHIQTSQSGGGVKGSSITGWKSDTNTIF